MATHQLAAEVPVVTAKTQQQQAERKPRPQPADQPLKCPRCSSTNTKFCYYNNYSLSQPRYFCKGCKRYWTQGGTLRNVPVGGGYRKNKRSTTTSSTSTTASKKSSDKSFINSSSTTTANLNGSAALLQFPPPPLPYDANDLTFAFAGLQKQSQNTVGDCHNFILGNANSAIEPTNSFLDILNGFIDTTSTTAASGLNNLHYGNFVASVETTVNGGEDQQGEILGVEEHKMPPMDQWQDYWSSFAASNWHGLINSSLI